MTAFLKAHPVDVIQAYSFKVPLLVAATKLRNPRPLRVLSLHSLDLERYPPKSAIKKLSRMARLQWLCCGFGRRFAVSKAVFDSYEKHAAGFATDVVFQLGD